MNQSRGREPRHERGVLDRIPEPPAAPTQFVVGPPAAERNANGQEHPGGDRPRPRPPRTGRAQTTRQPGRNGEGEGHGEPDVAHVENRRMHHQGRVLEEGVQVVAVQRRWKQPLERIRREQRKEQHPDAHDSQDAEHAGSERFGKAAAADRDGQRPDGQDEDPQQQRSFMSTPDCGDLVRIRQRRVRVGGDVEDSEIVVEKRVAENQKCGGHEHE